MAGIFNRFEWQIAGRYIRSRRREGVISLIAWASFLGIMIGVATLIIVMAVMNGFRADLLERILGVGGHAVVRPYGGAFQSQKEVVDRLVQLDGVQRVTPVLEAQVMVSVGTTARGAILRGVDKALIPQLPVLTDNKVLGDLSRVGEIENTTPGIAIGQRMAEIYGLEIGMPLSLIAPKGAKTPFGTAPRVRQYSVESIFEVGLSDYDATFIYTDMDTVSALTGTSTDMAALEIVVAQPDKIQDLRPAIDHAVEEAGWVRDWQQTNAALSGALKVERNVMFLILTMILLVASLNIVSGLVMLVKDKSRDIAILRTMGMKRGAILRIFFITGASIGVIGTLVGVIVGVVFCQNIEAIRQLITTLTGTELFPSEIYFLNELPAKIIVEDVVMVAGLSLALSFLSTLYPSWRAASLAPVEVLRND
ncbi:MAG: lipoprotein-releasing ABC transporter permease subunit [Pseudomonadota bacterium]|nr:lipoprotein-releasing ABC transporter permease subunit [Pseudomonadota bacterium]MEC7552456.1 lipoprotein-releasing ABC transporter permease subunit [Pseudomonadota bacterium]MEC8029206.1 lipoprotein-releasing ABC transporter permease subunit [Pseudomonadota bacterium]MEC8210661.1 lipoprotein-releasing ABC transporter permease subunit [Pseudomonadota bacterium]MEC8322397.1 lipoprotein-releasing ABC transporter permease subunit [Pseudomonadota bacterium]